MTQHRSKRENSFDRFEVKAKEMGFHDFIKIRKLHFLAGRDGWNKIDSPIETKVSGKQNVAGL